MTPKQAVSHIEKNCTKCENNCEHFKIEVSKNSLAYFTYCNILTDSSLYSGWGNLNPTNVVNDIKFEYDLV